MKLLGLAFTVLTFSAFAQHVCSRGHAHSFSRAIRTEAVTDLRSDTIDLIHNNLEMDFDFENKYLKAKSTITFRSLMDDVSSFKIDLEGLNVTSMTIDGAPVSYRHTPDSTGYRLTSENNFSKSEQDLVIEYEGNPRKELWGGFDWVGDYGYHIGVAFQDIPHSFGRVTFPCFDNFVEKNTYSFDLICPSNKIACAVGVLTDSSSNDSISFARYQMNQPISSYLVGIHIGPYHILESEFEGIEEQIPVWYYTAAADSSLMVQNFSRLIDAFNAYERSYGPYPFEKIGYSLVPFNSGAMEHATNISFPITTAREGTGEGTMAHELAHMWWGNMVTTENAGMMWLNEGFASYCEFVFWEEAEGYQKYRDEVKSNALATLQYAHILDSGYYAINNVPLEWTYGRTTYDKGAMIVNNFRNFIGNDSLFNDCLMKFLETNKWGTMSGNSFQEYFEQYFDVEMNNFFDRWVYDAGFPDFKIDYWEDGSLFISQQLRACSNLYIGMPLEVRFYREDWTYVTKKIYLTSGKGEYKFSSEIDFEPIYIALDFDEKMADAGIAYDKVIDDDGRTSFSNIGFKMDVDVLNVDSALLRTILHMTPAEPQSGITVNPSHYWRVEGIFDENTWQGYFEFQYDGRDYTYNGINWDSDLLSLTTEQDLKLFYRADASKNWEVVTLAEHNIGSTTDNFGNFRTTNMKQGEYCIGLTSQIEIENNYIEHASASLINSVLPFEGTSIEVFPNPTKDVLNFENQVENISIRSIDGKVVKQLAVGNQIDVSDLASGTYLVSWSTQRKQQSSKFVVN